MAVKMGEVDSHKPTMSNKNQHSSSSSNKNSAHQEYSKGYEMMSIGYGQILSCMLILKQMMPLTITGAHLGPFQVKMLQHS